MQICPEILHLKEIEGEWQGKPIPVTAVPHKTFITQRNKISGADEKRVTAEVRAEHRARSRQAEKSSLPSRHNSA
jgi:hypothetical protein